MKVSGVTATYYYTQDLERATQFYTQLLGSAPTEALPGIFSEWVFENDSAFGVYAGQQFRPSDGVMFIVDDVPAAVATCKSNGVDIDDHIEETGRCSMAFGRDADGNGFILHTHKAGYAAVAG